MHLKHALLDRWRTKGRDVSGEGKEIVGGRQIPLLHGREVVAMVICLQIYEYDEEDET